MHAIDISQSKPTLTKSWSFCSTVSHPISEAIDARVRDLGNVRVAQMAEGSTLPACFNRGVEEASGEYVMMMDDDCLYGERYVADTILSAGFAGTEILGKGTYFLYDENSDTMTLKSARPEHQLTDFLVGSTLVARRDLLLRTRFPERGNDSRSAFLDEALRAGCRAYSTDRFNHVAVGGALRQTGAWRAIQGLRTTVRK